MRYLLALLLLPLTLCAGGPAPTPPVAPQMTWTGLVSGSTTLFIKDKMVDAQGRDTGAVDRPRFSFRSPLPAERQTVEVKVRSGRGKVSIVEQPVPENEYSAIVQIEPELEGPDLPQQFRLDFFWERQPGNSKRPSSPAADRKTPSSAPY